MKKSLSFILTFSSLTLSSFARTVSGIVVTENDSVAIAGVTCRILSENKLLAGSVTDSHGKFSISYDSKDKSSENNRPLLEVSMTGYSPTEIILKPGQKDIDLGKIYLSEGVTLNEVTVSSQGPVESKGRMIVFPTAAEVKASSSSIRLFQKMPFPGLMANPINRSISVDGGTPVILINGIPATIEDFNALQPKDIQKIEYSRITPIRYADKGNNGLINITLKERNDGGQFYAWGRSATLTAFMDANVRASYHQGPSQFTLSYNPSWRNYDKAFDTSSESFIGDDFRVDLNTKDRNPFNYFNQNMRLKYDFSPNIKTLFSATFRATPYTSARRVYAETEDSFLGCYNSYSRSSNSNFAPSLDLFLRRDFNDRNSLEAQLVGTLSSDKYRRDNEYNFTDEESDNYIMNVDSRRRSLISELSYIHTFSQNTSLGAGLQNTVSRSDNKYHNSDYNPVLSENNNYIYARLSQTIGKVYLSVSSGLKMFWVKNDLNRRHFIRNLTTARLTWNIDERWNMQGSFQYYPSIPSLSSLTDYPQQTTPYLISNGNPDLKVSNNFYYRLYCSFKSGKFFIDYGASYHDSKNNVIDDITYIGNHLFLSQSVNARVSRFFSNQVSMKISDISGFGANIFLGFTHYESAGEEWKHILNTFEASASLWWNHGPFTISYWRSLPGKSLDGHVVRKNENGDALSFEYTPNKHWTVGIDWMYMFDRKGTRYPSWSYSSVNPFTKDRYIKNNSNMIVLTLSYSADFGSIFRTARRSLNNSDNSSSILRM